MWWNVSLYSPAAAPDLSGACNGAIASVNAPPQFDALVGAHQPMLLRIAASYEADPDRRRDLLQDVLLAIWRALPSYRGEGDVRAFLARIAHNRGVSHVARETAQPPTDELHEHLVDTAPDSAESTEQRRRQERLMAAVRSLPLALRQPVVLTLEGFGPKEIADILGLNANTVSIRLTRAKAALRAALSGAEE